MWLVLPLQARAQDLTLNAALPYGGRYVPGVWMPMRVEVVNGTDRSYPGATVHITPAEITIPEFRATLNLLPHTRQRLWMWVELGKTNRHSASGGSITLHDSGGARLAMADLAGSPIVETVDYAQTACPVPASCSR